MAKTPPLHLIFDLDGTLFDTEYEVSVITADIARSYGCDISSQDVFIKCAGMGSQEKFREIAEICGVALTDLEVEAMSQQHESRKSELYEQPVIKMMPSAKECLSSVAKAGWLASLGSSNPSARSKMGLTKTGLRHHFNDRVFGPDLTQGRKKPDPAVFNAAVAQSGVGKEKTVVVEDNETGILAGKAAGAFVVALLDPRFGKGRSARNKAAAFKQAGADIVVRDLKSVVPQVKKAFKLK